MHLEPLTRAIESADFLGFREIAQKYLVLRGYQEVEVKDGWKDGGTDFAVWTHNGNATPLAIAVTVQKADWQAKVKKDCRRAKDELGLTNVLYVSSHRRAAGEFTAVSEDLWETDGISVRSADSQALASLFFEKKEARIVLDALGISSDDRRPESVQRPDLKEDAAYAFALFGEASEKFRHSVVEQTVLSYLISTKGGMERGQTEHDVAEALQLHGDQTTLISSAIDRMLQKQRLLFNKALLSVHEEIAEGFEVMRTLRERQWKELQRGVDNCLSDANLLGDGLERASNAVMARSGALFMDAATSASAAIGIAKNPAPIRRQLRRRLKEITNALMSAGMAEDKIDECVHELTRIVSNSEIGRVLMVGELFVSLASMQTNHFERAFGVRGGSEIYLDASVAIPMIAALLYEPAEQRFSESALRIFELARSRSIPLLLPRVYLAEAASHLLEALDLYKPLLGTDDDLRYSTNAFVAHFSDLTARKRLDSTFLRYAENLGYAERRTSLQRQREDVSGRLALIVRKYDINVVDFPTPGPDTLTEAQEAMAFTARELGLARQGRLLEHDAGVVAHFMESELNTDTVRIFCTWDRLHLQLQTPDSNAHWQPLNPPMLGDLLILTRPDDGSQLMTTVDVAMELDEEDSQRGAAVLDTLVRIESGNLHDAELLRMVRDFKQAWVQALRDNAQPEDMADAWSAWKSGSRELLREPQLPL